jgi:cytoskeletal protein CcmA (bactofilin family)
LTNPPAEQPKVETNIREMLVGREVTLSGKIGACDRLMVEGSVEATLLNCGALEIGGPGMFKGTATVENAEISGRFEGTLTVRKRLLIQESGRVSGEVRYGQLEVQLGGRLSGDIGSVDQAETKDAAKIGR